MRRVEGHGQRKQSLPIPLEKGLRLPREEVGAVGIERLAHPVAGEPRILKPDERTGFRAAEGSRQVTDRQTGKKKVISLPKSEWIWRDVPHMRILALKQKRLWYLSSDRPRIIGLPQPPQVGRTSTFGQRSTRWAFFLRFFAGASLQGRTCLENG